MNNIEKITCAIVTLLFSVLTTLLFPRMIESMIEEGTTLGKAFFILALVLIVLFVIALLLKVRTKNECDYFSNIKKAAVFILICLGVILLSSVLCGFMSIGVDKLFKDKVPFETIKTITDMLAVIIYLFVTPLLVILFFSINPKKEKIFVDNLKNQFSLRKYLKLLFFFLVVYIIGFVSSPYLIDYKGFYKIIMITVVSISGYFTYYLTRKICQ